MWSMAIDFAAEGLLDGAPDERARNGRLELLRTLEGEGFSLEELRRATREGRLALLPVERVLAAEGARYTQEEIAEETGLEIGFLDDARRAVEVNPFARRIVLPEDFEMPTGGLNIRWPDPPLDQEMRLHRYAVKAAQAFARANGVDHIVLDSPRNRLFPRL